MSIRGEWLGINEQRVDQRCGRSAIINSSRCAAVGGVVVVLLFLFLIVVVVVVRRRRRRRRRRHVWTASVISHTGLGSNEASLDAFPRGKWRFFIEATICCAAAFESEYEIGHERRCRARGGFVRR